MYRRMSRTGLNRVEGLPGVELVGNPLGANVGRPTARPGAVGTDSREIVTGVLGLPAEQYQALVESRVVFG